MDVEDWTLGCSRFLGDIYKGYLIEISWAFSDPMHASRLQSSPPENAAVFSPSDEETQLEWAGKPRQPAKWCQQKRQETLSALVLFQSWLANRKSPSFRGKVTKGMFHGQMTIKQKIENQDDPIPNCL